MKRKPEMIDVWEWYSPNSDVHAFAEQLRKDGAFVLRITDNSVIYSYDKRADI